MTCDKVRDFDFGQLPLELTTCGPRLFYVVSGYFQTSLQKCITSFFFTGYGLIFTFIDWTILSTPEIIFNGLGDSLLKYYLKLYIFSKIMCFCG